MQNGGLMLGIIGAMENEIIQLKKAMEQVSVHSFASMEFNQGILNGKEVVIVRSGIGKVNAGICAQILVDKFQVEKIINTGIAGSLNADIDIGDIVLSTDAMQHDVSAGSFGYNPGIIPQMKVSAFKADETLLKLAKQVCEKVNPDIHVFTGRVVSGDQFIADKEKKNWILQHFHPLCTEMEGAAIAQAAYLNEVPYLIIRAISDKADDSAELDYPTFEAQAIEHTVKLMKELILSI